MGHQSILLSKGGGTYYTYTEPEVGDEGGVTPSKPSSGVKIVADIHSHAAWAEWGYNNEFSDRDTKSNDKNKTIGYLTTPNGTLQKYDPSTKKEPITLKKDLPSDQKDPTHKNNKDARSPTLKKDEPTANKTREKNMKAEAKKIVDSVVKLPFQF